ncbi:hypothetical protein Acsp01_80770 [Actinoplanes sp. NBRC 101535]|nr:hypothetical protein Acsp01_80770 [Actinoplanes sp. NBRC 101535]
MPEQSANAGAAGATTAEPSRPTTSASIMRKNLFFMERPRLGRAGGAGTKPDDRAVPVTSGTRSAPADHEVGGSLTVTDHRIEVWKSDRIRTLSKWPADGIRTLSK